MAQKFEYLHYGLGALLVFVGVKMLVEDIVGHLPVGVSLGVIVAVLGASVGASLLLSSRDLRRLGRQAVRFRVDRGAAARERRRLSVELRLAPAPRAAPRVGDVRGPAG